MRNRKIINILLSIILFISILILFSVNNVTAANILGDVNGNNKIESGDFLLVRKHIFFKYRKNNGLELSKSQQKLADMNKDGEIGSLDFVMISNIIFKAYKQDTDNNNQQDTGNNNQQDTGNNNQRDTGNNNQQDTGNNNQQETVVNVSNVTINKTSLTLTVGKSEKLIAQVSPENATNKELTWTSSNSKIASVDKNGKVTAIARGTATITIQSNNGKQVTSKVTVKEPIDLVLMWGQSNMVGRGGKTEGDAQLDKKALTKAGVDQDIVNNTKSYSRVELSMKKGMAYEYYALTNKLIDISTNPKQFGETAYYNNGNLVKTNPNDGSISIQRSTATNMIPYFAKEYTEKTNHKLAVVFAAHGGERIGQFLPTNKSNLYNALVKKYQMAEKYLKSINFVINNRFYVVYQGESDAFDKYSNDYEKTYMTVHNGLVKKLNLSFGAMVYVVRGAGTCDNVNVKKIHDAQVKIVKDNSAIILGSNLPYKKRCIDKDEAIFGGPGNTIHLNAAGLSQVGRDIAQHITATKRIKEY